MKNIKNEIINTQLLNIRNNPRIDALLEASANKIKWYEVTTPEKEVVKILAIHKISGKTLCLMKEQHSKNKPYRVAYQYKNHFYEKNYNDFDANQLYTWLANGINKNITMRIDKLKERETSLLETIKTVITL